MKSYTDQDYYGEQPEWFAAEKISLSIDEEKMADKDTMTLVAILSEAKNVRQGEIIELVTSNRALRA